MQYLQSAIPNARSNMRRAQIFLEHTLQPMSVLGKQACRRHWRAGGKSCHLTTLSPSSKGILCL